MLRPGTYETQNGLVAKILHSCEPFTPHYLEELERDELCTHRHIGFVIQLDGSQTPTIWNDQGQADIEPEHNI